MEKKGRGGKTVTVVYDLPKNDAFLKEPESIARLLDHSLTSLRQR